MAPRVNMDSPQLRWNQRICMRKYNLSKGKTNGAEALHDMWHHCALSCVGLWCLLQGFIMMEFGLVCLVCTASCSCPLPG